MNFILFEGGTRFCEKTKRCYVGYKTVANCPGHVAENPELNYSIFVKDGCSYSMQGPLYFYKHDCEPNCSYEVQKCKKGVVLLRTVVNIEKDLK